LQALAALRGRRFGGDARRTPPVLRANAAASADRATPESANPAPKAVRAGRAGSSVGSAHAA